MKDSTQHKFHPVGRCIYCGATGVNLTNEHIIAEGLGGVALLPKATCDTCKDITSKIETVCLRGPLGNIRLGAEVKRKKKNKPRQLINYKIFVQNPDGSEREVDLSKLSKDELPTYFYYPLPVNPPAILTGLPVDEQIEMRSRHFHKDTQARLLALGHKGYIEAAYDERPYLSMLGKIALGFVVAQYGLDAFIPLVQDLALGREEEPLRYIGRCYEGEEGYSDAMHEYMFELIDEHFIAVRLRLFGTYGLPTYKIVVGIFKNPDLFDDQG
ncbi:HNH endonuclease [Caballeronia sordidicola]|nr:HNH endonuclease [Caballeronia sordidicola]